MSDDKQLTGKKRSRAEAAATPAAASDDEGTDSKKLAVQGPTSPIAVPMAGKKLHKKVYKVVTKAAKAKSLRRGVKEVVKAIRKGQSGLCVLAGDISPVDVISHIPVLCEDNDVPYIFVSGKADLGAAAATKRPTSVVLVHTAGKGDKGKPSSAALEKMDMDKVKEVLEEVAELPRSA